MSSRYSLSTWLAAASSFSFIAEGSAFGGSVSVISCHARLTPGICLKMPPEAWKTIEFANATTRPVGPDRPLAAQLHQMQPHEAEVDDFAGHAADLHAIADPDAVFPDEEEIADDGDEHALHGHRDDRR